MTDTAKEKAIYNPVYLEGDPTNPLKVLEDIYSKSEVRRLLKQKSIKIGTPHMDEVWVKVGKALYIIQENVNMTATESQIWYEYHRELMPKKIKWETL